jgi:AcrR family transcriptional regulator
MSSRSPEKPQRWERKRTVTRARVLEAAAAAIEATGFQRTSLDEIAARAGLTKGAVYSSFASKDELFLAVLEEKPLRLDPKLRPHMTKEEYFRALGESASALLPRAREQAAFFAEFMLYALTHEEMRERMARRYADRFRELASSAPLDSSERLALPGRDMSNLIQALSLGLLFQHMMTPQEITPELVIKAFDLLAADPKSVTKADEPASV